MIDIKSHSLFQWPLSPTWNLKWLKTKSLKEEKIAVQLS